jgi:hypothetical protein
MIGFLENSTERFLQLREEPSMEDVATPAVLLTVLLINAPAVYGQTIKNERRDTSRFSDRDRRADWAQDKEALERTLKTGQNKDFYRKELEKAGFMITAVNYNRPDYVEWEVVKWDKSYELQIEIAGGKATKIAVAANMWRAGATRQAMQGKKVAAPATSDARSSDRDREVGWKRDEKTLQLALEAGQDRDSYRKDLERMGYRITAINYDGSDYVEWEIVKGDQTYEIQMHMADGKANKVDVAANLWRSDATNHALEGMSDAQRRSTFGQGKVKEIQKALRNRGYDSGPVDGIMGEKTRQALRDFQKAKDFEATGRLDDQTAEALGVSRKDSTEPL